MAVCNITEIKSSLPRGRRIMGLDVGAKTIGLALADLSLTVATPYETLRRSKFTKDAERLAGIVEAEDVGALVIGLPLSMDGAEGRQAQSVRQFAVNLAERLDIPVALWDERLSTAAVTRTLLEADASRKRRAEVVDKMAAAYILQGALDRLANL